MRRQNNDHLKRILKLDRLRLRGPCAAQDEFTLAAIAQNLRRLAKLVVRHHRWPPLVLRKHCGCQCCCLKGSANKWSGRSRRIKDIEPAASFIPSPISATKSVRSRDRVLAAHATKRTDFPDELSKFT
jgi:hypothetical protein